MDYSYFAFLDVMGYRAYLNEDIKTGAEVFRGKLIDSSRNFDDIDTSSINIKTISDSVFMSSSSDLCRFLLAVKKVYLAFLKNGLLIRGGVAYNKHYQSTQVTYSLALSDAYVLESDKAVFPRILIDTAVIAKIYNSHETSPENSEYKSLIDNNLVLKVGGHYQLNVIVDSEWESVYRSAKQIYDDNKHIINKDPKVYQYHLWLHNYIMEHKPKGRRLKKYMESFEFLPNPSV